jgi:YjbR
MAADSPRDRVMAAYGAKPGSAEDYPFGDEVAVFKVAGKMFALVSCRSSRRPPAARKTGPSLRSPTARSIARAVRGARGMVATLPPLRASLGGRVTGPPAAAVDQDAVLDLRAAVAALPARQRAFTAT